MNYTANAKRYETMRYNRCGKSGVKLPAVSLGLWHNFGSVSPYEESKRMLMTSFDMGINHFDLANNYGPAPGSAEETLGRVLKAELAPYRDELFISTKAGYHMWEGPYGDFGSKKYLVSSLEQSLKRLGLDYVDLFYHHRPDHETPLEESMDALAHIVKSGKALYVGISNYGPEDTRRACELLKGMGVHCLIHQMNYSMLNRTNEAVLDVLEEQGVGSIAFSPLAQGVLSGKYNDGIPKDSRAAGASVFLSEQSITPEVVEKTRRLAALAAERGQSLAQLALAWVLRGGRVNSVLIGVSRTEQIAQNVETLRRLDFSPEELARIEEILA